MTGTKKKRVLFLIPSLSGGGAERVFTILLRHLDRSRFEPQLAVLEAKGAYVADIPSDVVVHDLRVRRVRYALPHIIWLIWRTRPQIVVSTLGHLNIALSMFRWMLPADVKIVVREAVVVSSLLREELGNSRLWTWLYRHSYKHADKVICLSDSMVEDMVNSFGLPRKKLIRIYNPVEVARVREQADLGSNPYSGPGPHLVAAGRLTRQKGFDVLLDAMPAVLQELPTARLTILGEGPLRSALETQARTLGLAGVVSLPGFERNPWRYLRHANIFVLPSRYEGLPNVMLEALALGTPVVAADCPGAVKEVYQFTNGISLVPMEDSAALAQAVTSGLRRGETRLRRFERADQCLPQFRLESAISEYSEAFEL